MPTGPSMSLLRGAVGGSESSDSWSARRRVRVRNGHLRREERTITAHWTGGLFPVQPPSLTVSPGPPTQFLAPAL